MTPWRVAATILASAAELSATTSLRMDVVALNLAWRGCSATTSAQRDVVAVHPVIGASEPELAPAGVYSPATRNGVRSSGSASSISLVKIRSERL